MQLLETMCKAVWGVPMLAMLLFCGVYYSFRLRGIQITHLPHSLRALFGASGGDGDLSPFQSTCVALAATIGTGNIVGVAAAILAGGPGAVFWMWISTLLCLPLRFVEGYLGSVSRRKERGGVLTGAFLYIEGVGKRFGRVLAFLYAFFCLMSSLLGMGTMVQSRSITDAVLGLSGQTGGPYAFYISCICGAVIVAVTFCAVARGISGISKVTSVLVPAMLGAFCICGVYAIAVNAAALPQVFSDIFRSALSPRAALGGTGAASLVAAMRAGISKGVFTNEAGTGTAAFAAGAAQTSPQKAGLAQMGIAVVDTLIVCSITALAILTTGSAAHTADPVAVAANAFAAGLPVGAFVVQISLLLFAFTSSLGVYYYGAQSLRYLTGGYGQGLYNSLFLLFLFLGSVMPLGAIWYIADIFNGLLAYCNVPALLLLGGAAVTGCIAAGGCRSARRRRNADDAPRCDIQNPIARPAAARQGERARV